MAATYTRAATRIAQAYAPGTQRSYYNKFNIFLCFLSYYKLDIESLNVNNAICYVQFLVDSKLSTPTIQTYISAIKAKLTDFGCNCAIWSHPRVNLMLRACSRTVAIFNEPKHVLTPHILTAIINRLNVHALGSMYKALFLLAFHGFLRISNLLPTSQTSNQTHRHLTRGDVSITHPGVKVFIKWSKTLQANRDTRILPLASIPGSPLCPMQAVNHINQTYPVSKHCPFFSYMDKHKLIIITQRQARSVLAQTLKFLGLDPGKYGFHTFRRSGASLAFSLGIPVEYIKAHGTWKSDAVYTYLDQSQHPLALTSTISKHLSTPYC